jgi:uncharacterized protein YdeI (YjbR/CyaY-like superfamily)
VSARFTNLVKLSSLILNGQNQQAMATTNATAELYVTNREAWRQWLLQNHDTTASVWLIIYKKGSGTTSPSYEEAVEEALCFGWIDSKPNKRDEASFLQFFSQRKPKSNWSALNKKRVAAMLKANKMHASGLAMIELAKKTGTWTALDSVEALEYPPALKAAFDSNKLAAQNFDAFPKSAKRGILEWIGNAKTEATLQKRITETVALAAQNLRANQWTKK